MISITVSLLLLACCVKTVIFIHKTQVIMTCCGNLRQYEPQLFCSCIPFLHQALSYLLQETEQLFWPNYMLYTTVAHLVLLIRLNLCFTHTHDICNICCLFFNNRQCPHANEQLQPLAKYVIHAFCPLCCNWAQLVKFDRSVWFSFLWTECCQLILNQIFSLFL
jgi:hypothetical protein